MVSRSKFRPSQELLGVGTATRSVPVGHSKIRDRCAIMLRDICNTTEKLAKAADAAMLITRADDRCLRLFPSRMPGPLVKCMLLLDAEDT
jgi:hypothetical protein